MKKHAILVVIALLSGLCPAACEISIAVNQVGYLPEAPKWCRCEKPPAKDYAIFTIGTDVVWRCVRRGDWKPVRPGAPAVEADFSDLRQPGDYLILSGTNAPICSGGTTCGLMRSVRSTGSMVRIRC